MKITIISACFAVLILGTAGVYLPENITSSNFQSEDFVSKITNLYRTAQAAIDDDFRTRNNVNMSSSIQEIINVTHHSKNYTVKINNITVWQAYPINITFTCNSSQESNVAIQAYKNSMNNFCFDLQIISSEPSEIANLSYGTITPKSILSKEQLEIITLAIKKSKYADDMFALTLITMITNQEYELDSVLIKHYAEFAKHTCSQMTNENLLHKPISTEFTDTPVQIEITNKTADFGIFIISQYYYKYTMVIHNAKIRGNYQNKDFQHFVDHMLIHITKSKKDATDKVYVNFERNHRDEDILRREILSVVKENLTKELTEEWNKI